MNEERLSHYAATWEPGTWHRLIAEEELKRRHARPASRSMIAAAVSALVALVIVALI
jgi:hypothetical protein